MKYQKNIYKLEFRCNPINNLDTIAQHAFKSPNKCLLKSSIQQQHHREFKSLGWAPWAKFYSLIFLHQRGRKFFLLPSYNQLQHGLRTPNEAFFIEIQNVDRQIGQVNSGAFGVFSAELSAHILVQWVLCQCFLLFNHYFYKKLSLYIHIPNVYLGFGFEFGQQKN